MIDTDIVKRDIDTAKDIASSAIQHGRSVRDGNLNIEDIMDLFAQTWALADVCRRFGANILQLESRLTELERRPTGRERY